MWNWCDPCERWFYAEQQSMPEADCPVCGATGAHSRTEGDQEETVCQSSDGSTLSVISDRKPLLSGPMLLK